MFANLFILVIKESSYEIGGIFMKKRIVALILGTTMVLGSLFSTGVYASSNLDVPEVSLGDVEQESSEGTEEDVGGSTTNEDIGNTSEEVEDTTEQSQDGSNDIVEEFGGKSKIPAGEYIDDVTDVGTGIRDELSRRRG